MTGNHFHFSKKLIWERLNLGKVKDYFFSSNKKSGQDKNEDIMEALSIDESKKPYFTYLVYFVTLAVIKKNNFEATKVLKYRRCNLLWHTC